jgi:hypothetical protein
VACTRRRLLAAVGGNRVLPGGRTAAAVGGTRVLTGGRTAAAAGARRGRWSTTRPSHSRRSSSATARNGLTPAHICAGTSWAQSCPHLRQHENGPPLATSAPGLGGYCRVRDDADDELSRPRDDRRVVSAKRRRLRASPECACVRACVHACVRACVRARVLVRVRVRARARVRVCAVREPVVLVRQMRNVAEERQRIRVDVERQFRPAAADGVGYCSTGYSEYSAAPPCGGGRNRISA